MPSQSESARGRCRRDSAEQRVVPDLLAQARAFAGLVAQLEAERTVLARAGGVARTLQWNVVVERDESRDLERQDLARAAVIFVERLGEQPVDDAVATDVGSADNVDLVETDDGRLFVSRGAELLEVVRASNGDEPATQ